MRGSSENNRRSIERKENNSKTQNKAYVSKTGFSSLDAPSTSEAEKPQKVPFEKVTKGIGTATFGLPSAALGQNIQLVNYSKSKPE